MSANESDIKQWSDPKDYGLPFLEITPIRPHGNPDLNSAKVDVPELDPVTQVILETPEVAAPEPVIEVMLETPLEADPEIETILGTPEEHDADLEIETLLETDEEVDSDPEIETILDTADEDDSDIDTDVEVEDLEPVARIEFKYSDSKAASALPTEKKKSSAWIWAVVLIGLGIIGVIVWQIWETNQQTAAPASVALVEKPIEEQALQESELIVESTPTDQNQSTVSQDTIPAVVNSNPNISNPAETGTTIANTATGNLIRIESQAERAQYFIIVGSLPNEKMALAQAKEYFGRSAELFLISPIDGERNYRLALSKFGSFREASAKLDEIKSQYTEELWILKY